MEIKDKMKEACPEHLQRENPGIVLILSSGRIQSGSPLMVGEPGDKLVCAELTDLLGSPPVLSNTRRPVSCNRACLDPGEGWSERVAPRSLSPKQLALMDAFILSGCPDTKGLELIID